LRFSILTLIQSFFPILHQSSPGLIALPFFSLRTASHQKTMRREFLTTKSPSFVTASTISDSSGSRTQLRAKDLARGGRKGWPIIAIQIYQVVSSPISVGQIWYPAFLTRLTLSEIQPAMLPLGISAIVTSPAQFRTG